MTKKKIAYQESAKAIDDLIQKKRAQIILEAQEPFYKEALLKLGDKQMEQAEAAIALSAQEIRAQEAKDKALEQGGLINVVAYENQKGILEDMQADYAKNEGILGDYYSTIQDFEENSAAVASSNYEKIKEINVGAVASYKTATDGTVEQLQRQAIEAEINAQLMRDRYNEGTKGVTEDMVKNAEETARKANEEYLKVGGEIVDGVEKGVKNKEGGFIATIRNMAQSAISAARKALDSHSIKKVYRNRRGRRRRPCNRRKRKHGHCPRGSEENRQHPNRRRGKDTKTTSRNGQDRHPKERKGKRAEA